MGWLLTSLAIAIVATLWGYLLRDDKDDDLKTFIEDECQYPIAGFLLPLFFIGVIGGAFSIGITRPDDTSTCRPEQVTYPIISTVREKDTVGSFVLGTGGINTIDRYYAYVEYPEGMLLRTFETRNTFIVEGSSNPHYSRTDHHCPMKLYDFLWWSSGNEKHFKGRRGTLHVPKGTILRKYEL